MKKLLMIIAFAAIVNVTYAQEKGVQFEQGLSWKQVLDKAQKEHKYIFVDCFATWCGPCKAMDAKTYPNDSVGNLISKSFIALKVQCDSTKNDPETIRSKYSDARQIVKEYHVNAFPTLLFLSPQGDLVHFGVGYYGPKEFIALAGEGLDPKRQYRTLLGQYKQGKLPYEQMPKLETMARESADTSAASAISRDYVHNYLEKLPEAAWLKKENLDALVDHILLLDFDSAPVQWLMHHSQIADSIMQIKGFSEQSIGYFLHQKEVDQVIKMAKKDRNVPDWNALRERLTQLAGNKYAKRLVADAQVDLYQSRKDWTSFCKAVIDEVDAFELMSDPKANAGELNNDAFEIFTYSNDREQLLTALKWMDSVANAITESTPNYADMLDTKAELLYKLGRKDEAILIEERAVNAEIKKGEKTPHYQPMLEKMRAGQSTW